MVISLTACGGSAAGTGTGGGAGSTAGAAADGGSGGSETDIMYTKEDIKASINGIGDWESQYDMAVQGDEKFTWGYIDMGFKDTFTTKIRNTFKY